MDEKKPLTAKRCFGHLGGTPGNRLFERLCELKWFEPENGEPRRYALTRRGIEEMIRLGVDPYPRR